VANISANNFLRENSATKWFKNLFVNEGFLVVSVSHAKFLRYLKGT
jgi:hypothetical protein